MTRVAELAEPARRGDLARLLAAWIPRQRWFAGKARGSHEVEVDDVASLAPGVLDVFVTVAYSDGGRERYQVPLADGEREEGARGAVADGIVDAMTDERACRRLAELALGGTASVTARGARIAGLPLAGEPPSREERLRLLGAEQSNTSVVFGDRLILKLFRKLEAGVNPDVEITRALSAAGFPYIPAQRGAVELHSGDGATSALAVLADLVCGAREGWELAVAEVGAIAADRSLAAAANDPDTGLVLDRLDDLGRAIAELHVALGEAFGTREAAREDLEAVATSMQRQLDDVLALAAQRAPDAAAAVLEREQELRRRFDGLARLDNGGVFCRTHGDLHLGQVLLDADGRWRLLDFEGEPARPLEERRALQPPLRDVAGMLRSFDYAAATTGGGGGIPPAVAAWRDEARERFLSAYVESARPAGLLPGDDGDAETLLDAFELDKAVYELGYELANRPSWVPIPVGGILRVLGGAEAGKPVS